MLGVLPLIPGVLFLGPRSVLDVKAPGIGVPGVASSWALRLRERYWLLALLAPGHCWLLDITGSWALRVRGHCWLLDIAGSWRC